MTVKPTYLNILSENYPNLLVRVIGNSDTYESLINDGEGVFPTKEELDTLILAKTKENMWKLIQAERDRRRSNGVNVGGNWFHSDDTSRIQQLGLLLMGVNMPPGIMWKTMSGTFVEMTPTLAQQIFQNTGTQDMQIFGVAEWHRSQMNASSTPETYDFSGNWPATFGG